MHRCTCTGRSRLFQRTCLTVDPSATAILGEILLPGRVAHGEAHAYDLYWAETEARRPDGRLLFADTLRLRPGDGHPTSPGLLGGHDVLATLYFVSTRIDPAKLVTVLRAALTACDGVLGGATELPGDCGATTRLLGDDSRTVQAAVRTVWNAARMALLGTPAPELRKG